MKRASDILSEDDHTRITQAVMNAEAKTSAEIAPVVATESGRYDRPEDIVGLWLGLTAMIVVWILFPATGSGDGSWGGISPWWKLLAQVVATVVGFVIGAVASVKIGWLRRLFTPEKQMQDEVIRRAREAFFDRRVHHTAGGSGVLIFVSLFERKAAVIGDESVLQAVGQPQLDEWCRSLTRSLSGHPLAEAIAKTIERMGAELKDPLPRADDDVNELSDAVVVLN